MKIIEFSFNLAVFCSLQNTRKKALEPKIFEALLRFPEQPPGKCKTKPPRVSIGARVLTTCKWLPKLFNNLKLDF